MPNNRLEIVLASSSPRRRELLSLLPWPFRIVVPQVVEEDHAGEAPEAYALRMAQEKAACVANRMEGPARIVGADTVVVLDGRVLGQPTDEADARAMLQSLSGRTHRVVTGLYVVTRGAEAPFSGHGLAVGTEVDMRSLSEAEIAAYVASGEPMDKAGAYAIQGGAAHMVCSIRGSYTNVVGLPLAELFALLDDSAGNICRGDAL